MHQRVVGSLGLAGIAAVALGAALPWITIYHGLTAVSGFSGDGAPLLGFAIAAVLLWGVYVRSGRPLPLQLIAAGAALVTAGYSAFDGLRIARYVADPGPTGPLAAPTFGPGSVVFALGGLLILAAILLTPSRQRRLPSQMGLPLLTAMALFTAGWIHLMLTGEHLDEATILGIGFLLSGVVQVGLAMAIATRPHEAAYYGVIAVNAALIFLYAFAVLKGLPIGSHDHAGGLALGSGESIDIAGAVSKAAELLSLVAVFVLLGRVAPARPASVSTVRLSR